MAVSSCGGEPLAVRGDVAAVDLKVLLLAAVAQPRGLDDVHDGGRREVALIRGGGGGGGGGGISVLSDDWLLSISVIVFRRDQSLAVDDFGRMSARAVPRDRLMFDVGDIESFGGFGDGLQRKRENDMGEGFGFGFHDATRRHGQLARVGPFSRVSAP
jgi:hypothetical protein